MQGTTRGVVNVVDIILGLVVLIAIMVTAPYWYKFTDMAAAEADPLSTLLLQLIVPTLVVGLLISMGVSARGAG